MYIAQNNDPFQYFNDIAGQAPTSSLDFSAPENVLTFGVNIVFGIGLVIAMLFIVISGIKFITGRGDPGKVEEAKSALTSAIIAFILVIGALTIANVIFNIFDVGTGGSSISILDMVGGGGGPSGRGSNYY